MPETMSWEEFHQMQKTMRDPFLAPIGKFVFEFGLLEKHVDEAIGTLMEVHTTVGSFAMRPLQSLKAKSGLYDALAQLKTIAADTDLREPADQLTDELEDLLEFRNDLVHGPWNTYFSDFGNGEPTWQKLKLSGSFGTRSVEITISDVEAKTTRVTWLGAQLKFLAQQIIDRKKTRPEHDASLDTRA